MKTVNELVITLDQTSENTFRVKYKFKNGDDFVCLTSLRKEKEYLLEHEEFLLMKLEHSLEVIKRSKKL